MRPDRRGGTRRAIHGYAADLTVAQPSATTAGALRIFEAGRADIVDSWRIASDRMALPGQPQRHLDQPRRKRASDGSERGIRSGRIGRLEVRLIKQVEELGAILQPAPLAAQGEVLVQSEVGLVERVAAHGITAGIA